MNSWKVILATIVIFGAGVITGGLLVNNVKQPFRAPRPVLYDVPVAFRPEILSRQFVERLNHELNLSKQQSNQIQKIIAQGQESTRQLWKGVAPQFQIVWRDTRLQIRDVLTQEQKKQFEMLMKQQRQLRHPPATNAPPSLPSSATNVPAA